MHLPTVEDVLEQLKQLADENYTPPARAAASRWAWQFVPNLSVDEEHTPVGRTLGYLAGADTPTGVPGDREFLFEDVDFDSCRATLLSPKPST